MTDSKILLERNGLWNEEVEKYVQNIISNCRACHAKAPPQLPRKVSFSPLTKNIDEIVCIDHFYLDETCFIHFMNLVSRYSVTQIVENTQLHHVVSAFEHLWKDQFWYPETIRGNDAFLKGKFKEHIDELGIKFELVPKQRHYKNAIESKHSIIRSMFIRLKEHQNEDFDQNIAIYKAISISNTLW